MKEKAFLGFFHFTPPLGFDFGSFSFMAFDVFDAEDQTLISKICQ